MTQRKNYLGNFLNYKNWILLEILNIRIYDMQLTYSFLRMNGKRLKAKEDLEELDSSPNSSM